MCKMAGVLSVWGSGNQQPRPSMIGILVFMQFYSDSLITAVSLVFELIRPGK